jgi:tetratricopeptide (TPR) repeat protein
MSSHADWERARRLWLRTAISLLAALVPLSCLAAPIESLSVLYTRAEGSAVSLELSEAFANIISDRETGELCVYRLIPTESRPPRTRVMGRQIVPWEQRQGIPLERTEVEWRNSQLLLELNFRHSVHCTAQLSKDRRKLWITLRSVDDQITLATREHLELARQSLAEGQIQAAITHYQAILTGPENPLQANALEGLGIAQERQKAWQSAIETYQLYLREYPDNGAATERVRQRLQGLLLIRNEDPPPLREVTARQHNQPLRWFGVLSGSYQRYQSKIDGSENRTLYSSFNTDINLNGRTRNEDWDTRISLAGSYAYDLENTLDDPQRLSRAYVDVLHRGSGQQLVIGRQRSHGEGLLGRFDGLRYSKSIGEQWGVNLLAGFPVLSSRNLSLESDRQIYGTSLDIKPLNSPWSGNIFLTAQMDNGLTDREALGAEIAFRKASLSGRGYLDYDLFFAELNTLMFNLNWYGEAGQLLYLAVDYRHSPTLTLNNALIGQGVSDLQDLLNQSNLNPGDLTEIALDRTATSQTISFGASADFSENWKWNADLSTWKLSDTESSAGVSGFTGTDQEGALNLQLIANDLMKTGDIHWLTLRLAKMTNSDQISLSGEVLWPLGKGWRLRPQLRLSQRQFNVSQGQERSIKPRIKLEYLGSKVWNWCLEASQEWIQSSQNQIDVSRQDQYLYSRIDWIF